MHCWYRPGAGVVRRANVVLLSPEQKGGAVPSASTYSVTHGYKVRSPWDDRRSAAIISPAAHRGLAPSPTHAQGPFANPIAPREQHRVASALSNEVHRQPMLSPRNPQPTPDRQTSWASASSVQHPQGIASFARQESGGGSMRAQPSWYVRDAVPDICFTQVQTSRVLVSCAA